MHFITWFDVGFYSNDISTTEVTKQFRNQSKGKCNYSRYLWKLYQINWKDLQNWYLNKNVGED